MDMASWILGDEEGKDPRSSVVQENEEEEDAPYEYEEDEEKLLSGSGITSPTEQGSVTSEEDLFTPSTWLGGLGADFKNLASSLKETAGGVVGFVHRSAMSVAAEIAELEEGYSGRTNDDDDERIPLPLPWEVMVAEPDGNGVMYREDDGLKRKVLTLSSDENTFLTPFTPSAARAEQDDEAFVLDEARIQLIRHLLEVDENLALSHARLSGRSHVSEVTFWRNYFHHCEQTKLLHETEAAVDVPHGSEVDRIPMKQEDAKISRTKSDDESSFVCVNTDVISPPSSLNWSGMVASSDGDLVVLGNLKPAANATPVDADRQ